MPGVLRDRSGYDINRYHSYLVSDPRDDPNTGPVGVGQADNPVPEALAVRNAYDAAGGAAGVDVVLDLHHQGSKTDAAGQMVTGSTLWPNATATADQLGIRPQFDQVVYRSKQAVSTLVEAVAPLRVRELLALLRHDASRDLAQRLRPARLGVGADRDARRHRSEGQRLHRQDGIRGRRPR